MTVDDGAAAQGSGATPSLLVFREPAEGQARDAAFALLSGDDGAGGLRAYVLIDIGRPQDVLPEAAVSVVPGERSWRVARFAGDPCHHGRMAAELFRVATAAGARQLVAGPEASGSVRKLLNCAPVAATGRGGWVVVDLE